ncbi:MAG: hypothetical protein LBK71_04000 [Verrucomicrobiales bacterium]|jgi:hypothetical protein|nr:hypothetical protein [Verrucomicrobiales bacterium]MDR1304967.1 hypothetical protein [Verrucomicrobiales bacterium]
MKKVKNSSRQEVAFPITIRATLARQIEKKLGKNAGGDHSRYFTELAIRDLTGSGEVARVIVSV